MFDILYSAEHRRIYFKDSLVTVSIYIYINCMDTNIMEVNCLGINILQYIFLVFSRHDTIFIFGWTIRLKLLHGFRRHTEIANKSCIRFYGALTCVMTWEWVIMTKMLFWVKCPFKGCLRCIVPSVVTSTVFLSADLYQIWLIRKNAMETRLVLFLLSLIFQLNKKLN